MITLTKEWLQQTIAELEEERDAVPGAVNEDAAMALAAMKIALASLEAKPVAWIVHARTGDQLTTDGGYVANAEGILGLHSTPLYTAPPAPVSDSLLSELLGIAKRAAYEADECAHAEFSDDSMEHSAAIAEWERRAAILQSFGNSEQLNSPGNKDGWVACSERMPSPSTGVIVAAPWQSAPGGYAMKWATNCPGHPDADIDGWIIPGASWSPTHWMPLPAAPQKEVK